MKKWIPLLLALWLALFCFFGCQTQNEIGFLNAVASFRLTDGRATKARSAMREFLSDLEKEVGADVEGSDIYRINRASVGEKIEVGTHTQRLFALCLQYYGYTEGCFHPAMYAASTLWGFSADAQSYRVPTPEEQQAVKPLCDFSAFTLEGNMLSKSISGAMLDFGGIAKGYAVDCLKEIAESYGVTQGIIDLGGNLYLIGDKNGEPYTVAVTDPRPLGGTRGFFALTRLSDTSAVTSGDYENYFEEEGVRYSHIFDPKTCAPVRTDLVSVTVVDTCSARADILSTALFVMGYERAVAFAEENALSVVLVTAERRYYTKGVSIFDVDGGYQPI